MHAAPATRTDCASLPRRPAGLRRAPTPPPPDLPSVAFVIEATHAIPGPAPPAPACTKPVHPTPAQPAPDRQRAIETPPRPPA